MYLYYVVFILLLEPGKCPKLWILLYVVLAILVAMVTAVVILLYFFPQEKGTSVLVYRGDTVFLPLSLSIQWLKSITFSTNGPCTGELYQVNCSTLKPRYNSSYNTKYSPNPVDHLYCLNNSTFVFTLRNESVDSVGYVWLFTDYNLMQEVSKDYFKHDCSNPPEGTICHYLTAESNTTRITTTGPSNEGQYYFVGRVSEDYILFYIERYFYNISDFNYTSKNTLNEKHPVTVEFYTGFEPTQFSTYPNQCFLYDVMERCTATANTYQYVHVTASRREDVLLWPGVATIVAVALIPIALIIHAATYIFYHRCYDQMINRPMEVIQGDG